MSNRSNVRDYFLAVTFVCKKKKIRNSKNKVERLVLDIQVLLF